MASVTAWPTEPDGPSSSGAGIRDAPASPRSGTPPTALRGGHRFDAVFRTGKRVRRGGITVVIATGDPGPARVGLVAGRKVGNAVVRNRVKRRLRAALAQVELGTGTNYVVIATTGVATVPFETLVGWVRSATEQEIAGDGE